MNEEIVIHAAHLVTIRYLYQEHIVMMGETRKEHNFSGKNLKNSNHLENRGD
jgi:hypothetical protein